MRGIPIFARELVPVLVDMVSFLSVQGLSSVVINVVATFGDGITDLFACADDVPQGCLVDILSLLKLLPILGCDVVVVALSFFSSSFFIPERLGLKLSCLLSLLEYPELPLLLKLSLGRSVVDGPEIL